MITWRFLIMNHVLVSAIIEAVSSNVTLPLNATDKSLPFNSVSLTQMTEAENETQKFLQESISKALHVKATNDQRQESRSFLWGFASSAYQTEGAWNESRGPTIWDTFSQRPGFVYQNQTANVAADHYHRYKEDLKYLSEFKSNAYRFSISWSRLFLNGTGPLNEEGARYYSHLIDEILANKNQPIATLFHWDLPQAVQDNLGGWTDSRTVDAFVNYASQSINLYGDRVKIWLTFNEPTSFCRSGYESASWPPAQKMYGGAELCMHNIILAHARTARYLRKKYPGSLISMPLVTNAFLPAQQKDEHLVAKAYEFNLGWVLGPLINGEYPESMRKDPVSGSLLPSFTQKQVDLVKGTIDFIGYNYYTTSYLYPDASKRGGYTESEKNATGYPLGPVAASSWLYVYPSGLRKVAQWIHKSYPERDIWITENGVSVPDEHHMTLEQIVNDTFRVSYFKDHLDQLILALVDDKLPIRAYLAWSLLDNFEWKSGYAERFGVVGVDYTNGTLKRTVKRSALFLAEFFSRDFPNKVKNTVTLPSQNETRPKSDGIRLRNSQRCFVAIATSFISVLFVAI